MGYFLLLVHHLLDIGLLNILQNPFKRNYVVSTHSGFVGINLIWSNLILYFKSSSFEHLDLRKLDENGNPLIVVKWITSVIKSKDGFKDFVDHLISYSYSYMEIHHLECLMNFARCVN